MRILKFIGVFLGTLFLVLLIVFGFNLNALITLFENRESLQEGQEWVAKASSLKGLTEYIGAQPEHVSIASLTIENPDSSILYNEHTPRTMGRLSNIFLVIEYARLMDRDRMDADKRIPISEVNKYQLPYIDASNHEDALATLENEEKIASDGTVALSDLMRIAVEFNDLAVSDYLFYALGQEGIEQLMDNLSITETESLLPFSGLYITLNPFVYDVSFNTRMDHLSQLSRMEFEELVMETGRRYINDEEFREHVLHLFREHQGLGLKFTDVRDALDFFPKTTAYEMASLMKNIQQEALISESVSKKIKDIMYWPLNNRRLNREFKTYGAMYDSRVGMVNGIDFGVPSYSNKPFAQAVFFDNLQIAFWFHMSSNLMHQDFEQRLIWDPTLREATLHQIRRDHPPSEPSGD